LTFENSFLPCRVNFHFHSKVMFCAVGATLCGLFPVAAESTIAEPVAAAARSSGEENEAIPIKDVKRGQRVAIEGEVTRLRDTDEFVLSDPTGEIHVYIGWRNDMPVDVGDRVKVIGMADDDVVPGLRPEVYARMLILENGDRVNLRTGETLKPAEKSRVEADYEKATAAVPSASAEAERPVTPIREIQRGQRVRLQGKVTRIRDEDEFILSDDTGRVLVYIGWRNDLPVEVGDEVTVIGRADDDVLPLMRPEIYASMLILPGGEQVNLRAGQSYRTQ
jgi:uncharacterized protein YdeI (BOF family)